MRHALFATIATTAFLSAAISSTAANATTLYAPAALRAAADGKTVLSRVAIVCGSNGCGKVQTSAPPRRSVPLAQGR